jgi:ribose transport system permease protein/AI-2 transport system permease protein
MADTRAAAAPFRFTSPTAGREIVLLAAILAVGAGFALSSPYFLTVGNIVSTLRASLELAIVSAGMTLVIIMGGIDVSVGGILAVSAIFIGKAYQAGLPTCWSCRSAWESARPWACGTACCAAGFVCRRSSRP